MNKIMKLIPEIRKWFSFNGLKAVGEPGKIKRPWLSIIKQLIKTKYNIESKDFQFTETENILEHTFIVLLYYNLLLQHHFKKFVNNNSGL